MSGVFGGDSPLSRLPKNVLVHHIIPEVVGTLKGSKPYIKKRSAIYKSGTALYFACLSDLSVTIVKTTSDNRFGGSCGSALAKMHRMQDYLIEYGY